MPPPVIYCWGGAAPRHLRGGGLKAGDRIPPHLAVRRRDGSGAAQSRLGDLLDPSGFVLVVAPGDGQATIGAALADIAAKADVRVLELVPGEGAHYAHELGARSDRFLRAA